MNRLTLVLNTAILVVTFVVALIAGDVQGELLSSTTRVAGRGAGPTSSQSSQSIAVVRIAQSMESFYPAGPNRELTRSQLQTIRDAVDAYTSGIRVGLDVVLAGNGDADDVRAAMSGLGKPLRIEIESVLNQSFPDPAIARRLATEIIRNCR